MSPLTDDEIENLGKFRFEVWACGYNWLRSNKESAERVKIFIRDTVLAGYKQANVRMAAQKVILVTHSMGGLVPRRLCADEEGKNLVLGVVHGAMPANGAAEAYTNMRQGVQGGQAEVLGNSTANLAPVFTQC